MKKIVFVSGIQIFPPESGGQLRSANICSSLAKLGHQVEIYSFTGRRADYLKLRPSDEIKIADNLYEFTNRAPILGLIQYFFYKLGLPPFWLTWLSRFYRPLSLIKKCKSADYLILDFPFLYPLGPLFQKKVILNTHNAEFELYKNRPLLSHWVKKIELQSFKHAERVFFSSSNDQSKFTEAQDDLKTRALIVPNAVDLSKFAFSSKERDKTRTELGLGPDETVFIFTGSPYGPNIEALNFLTRFAEANSSALLAERIVLLVVGGVGTKDLERPYLKITGKVPAVLPYFWSADFGLNAVMSGSGTNVKMIEFMAAGLPLLSTSFGARGLSLKDGQSCFIFDETNFLSALIRAKTTSAERRKQMSASAFAENRSQIDMGEAIKSLPLEW